ncbi:hypothetical protein [Yinghuangia soli]|uniref:Uncharacterized protein n=1 Tax=Yinghuangia soli TaxID=2908204 RepID=A0AA41U8W7_9ACTN|nr:hypothetical protein [Yinghuangia soli]MCF2533309.1 hypothetical protein [Yinghuangia soli]
MATVVPSGRSTEEGHVQYHELKVLVTEARPGDSDAAAARLVEAGHQVYRCHPRTAGEGDAAEVFATEAGEQAAGRDGDGRPIGGRPASDGTGRADQGNCTDRPDRVDQAGRPDRPASCVAWEPGSRCPLTIADIDLVLDVRTAHGPETTREQGAMCAQLAGVPLVVCGPTDTSNSMLLRADVVCHPDRLQLACVSALSPVGATARRSVEQALRAALAGLGDPPPVAVSLELRDHTVVADVTVAAAPSATTYTRVRTVVRAALARFTPAWPYVPVTVHHAPAHPDTPASRLRPGAAQPGNRPAPPTRPEVP